ncbi:DUF4937 domain-containing protein [Paenibacillus jiagnxiensis]|uniref:DUF4937 domain-containing protein n=1 Tax=Paenibacillus jiagnxiensis TaxID=3228926 RepID=UPI0033BB4331
MFVKWIGCSVLSSKLLLFSAAQGKWSSLSNVEGCIGQLGGWEPRKEMSIAHIFGFWTDELSYQQFMNEDHDDIYERTGQSGTFEGINIVFGRMPGDALSSIIISKSDRIRCISENSDKASFTKLQLLALARVQFESKIMWKADHMKGVHLDIELEPSWTITGGNS